MATDPSGRNANVSVRLKCRPSGVFSRTPVIRNSIPDSVNARISSPANSEDNAHSGKTIPFGIWTGFFPGRVNQRLHQILCKNRPGDRSAVQFKPALLQGKVSRKVTLSQPLLRYGTFEAVGMYREWERHEQQTDAFDRFGLIGRSNTRQDPFGLEHRLAAKLPDSGSANGLCNQPTRRSTWAGVDDSRGAAARTEETLCGRGYDELMRDFAPTRYGRKQLATLLL